MASLFPSHDALRETERRAVATEAPDGMAVADRATLTLPVLNAASLVLLAATGDGKRAAFSEVLDAEPGGGPPAARLGPLGDLVWLVDRALAQGTDAG